MAFHHRPDASPTTRTPRSGRRARRLDGRGGHAFAPTIESMEARALLSNLVVTDPGDSGPGTLRQAILDANLDSTPDVIDFNIGGGGQQTITLASSLPALTNTVTIDGTSQPGYAGSPLIEINGDGLPLNALELTAPDCVVEGLVINNTTTTAEYHLDIGNAILVDPSANGFVIQGNDIGTDVTGSFAIPIAYGINCGATTGLIGGTEPGQGNVISGATIDGYGSGGILISTSESVLIEGNKIGTNAAGTGAIPNYAGVSVTVNPGPDTEVIGGTTPGAGNLISGNTWGSALAPGSPGFGGIFEGNLIGTDVTGKFAVPNQYGLGKADVVGGTVAGAGNVISGNAVDGVDIAQVVQGNYIGTDITGTVALGNGRDGVNENYQSQALIGGPTTAARNIIAANPYGDITNAVGTIENNFIGTDVTGERTLDDFQGTGIFYATDATILDNVISTGNGAGIRLPIDCVIQGNLIGTNKEGTAAIGNSYGILLLNGSVNDTIGGTSPGQGNVISGNSLGIYGGYGTNPVEDFNVVIEGNFIGTNASGTAPVPGNEAGIQFDDGVTGVTIGGTVAGSGNVIADNNEGGIIENVNGGPDPSYGISILGNSIYDNSDLGIDIGAIGVPVPNTPGGPPVGAADPQNFPVISGAYAGGTSAVVGTFNSTPNATFRLEFFSNPVPDPSGYGQGLTYLGFINVTTDGSGNASFTATGLSATSLGQWVSATATGPDGSTSEFAKDVVVTLAPSTTVVSSSASPSAFSQPVTFTATVAPTLPGTGTPTGSVTFYDGSTELGTGTLSGGSASLTTAGLAVGVQVITADYGGDSSYDATGADPYSTAVPFAQTVNPAATTTVLGSSANPWVLGQPVTFTADVSVASPGGGVPQGSVVFKDGSTVLGTVALAVLNGEDQAAFTTASLPAGTDTITATYINNDGNDLGSSGSLGQVILGPGVYAIGTQLFIVGANTSDYAQISPAGSRSDGTTGLQVNSTLNSAWSSRTFNQPFTAISIFGSGGNDNFQLSGGLTLPTAVIEGNGNNYLLLANGNDTVTLGTGSNQVFGGTGNKTITAQDLAGTSGYIQLGLGNESISLGAGNDQVVLGGGTVVVSAGNGNDSVTAGNGANTITLGNGSDYIHTGTGSDAIVLGSGNENVQLGDGNKTVAALGGNNYVSAGTGTDSVAMGSGADDVQLGGGANTVTLGDGNDYVSAGGGNNTVTVGNGNDDIQLGNGDNVAVEGNGNDYVSAGNGANLVVGGLGQHTIQLGNGSNILIDGSAAVSSNDSLRAILAAWKGGATAASLRPRLTVTYNVSHPNYLSAGSGWDWFFYTSPKTSSNKKPGDSLN